MILRKVTIREYVSIVPLIVPQVALMQYFVRTVLLAEVGDIHEDDKNFIAFRADGMCRNESGIEKGAVTFRSCTVHYEGCRRKELCTNFDFNMCSTHGMKCDREILNRTTPKCSYSGVRCHAATHLVIIMRSFTTVVVSEGDVDS